MAASRPVVAWYSYSTRPSLLALLQRQGFPELLQPLPDMKPARLSLNSLCNLGLIYINCHNLNKDSWVCCMLGPRFFCMFFWLKWVSTNYVHPWSFKNHVVFKPGFSPTVLVGYVFASTCMYTMTINVSPTVLVGYGFTGPCMYTMAINVFQFQVFCLNSLRLTW